MSLIFARARRVEGTISELKKTNIGGGKVGMESWTNLFHAYLVF
jgi:hypothetical protein